eukprot:TRINITY_DN2558_c1_g1_i1.p1 TRINITY_DN2558_c1_g1~~TRINITY_DN2558_c1_g1_i1.p1  ORF type:complete len:468 (+),score=116.23 TRINITY_DN2558_c1_g1_i1:84-1406(+)
MPPVRLTRGPGAVSQQQPEGACSWRLLAVGAGVVLLPCVAMLTASSDHTIRRPAGGKILRPIHAKKQRRVQPQQQQQQQQQDQDGDGSQHAAGRQSGSGDAALERKNDEDDGEEVSGAKESKALGESSGSAADPAPCAVQEHVELWGEHVVRWGADHIAQSAAECCSFCAASATAAAAAEKPPIGRGKPGCDTWVFCAAEGGCGAGRRKGECWLKAQKTPGQPATVAQQGPSVPWYSGEYVTADVAARRRAAVAKRARILEHPANPRVWLEVSIDGGEARRIEAVLLALSSPRAAENFRGLFAANRLGGQAFYRVLDKFIDQTGAKAHTEDSGMAHWNAGFDDDRGGLELRHDRKGLLSVANIGANTTTSHFSIMVHPAPHLDNHFVIFGEVVRGIDVVDAVNAEATKDGKPRRSCVILRSGCDTNCDRRTWIQPRAAKG